MAIFFFNGVLTDGFTAKRIAPMTKFDSSQDISEIEGEPCEVPRFLLENRSDLILRGLQSETNSALSRRRVW